MVLIRAKTTIGVVLYMWVTISLLCAVNIGAKAQPVAIDGDEEPVSVPQLCDTVGDGGLVPVPQPYPVPYDNPVSVR